MRLRIALLITALASLAMAGHPVAADPGAGGGANNIVRVQNQADGTLRARASAQVAQDAGPIVGNTNAASAASTCTDCQTVAVAVQVVLRSGGDDVFEPGNAATAVNSGCLRCHTFAYARQEILATDRPIPLSSETLGRVRAIEAQMQDVAASGRSDEEMAAALDSLSDDMVNAVNADVQAAGTSATRTTGRQIDHNDG